MGYLHEGWSNVSNEEKAVIVAARSCRITESQNHRITESQNGRGWKEPLWVI